MKSNSSRCPLPVEELPEVGVPFSVRQSKGGRTVEIRTGWLDQMGTHSYPFDLVEHWQPANGTVITIRPVRPDDAEIKQAFVRNLSPRSRYFRFMYTLKELPLQMLARFTQVDFKREMALIAVTGEGGDETEIGAARYACNPDGETCEFGLVVADSWQGRGLGRKLATSLMEAAGSRGIKTMEAEVLADNTQMLILAERLGFSIETYRDDPDIRRIIKAL